jgi:hypothetical protein
MGILSDQATLTSSAYLTPYDIEGWMIFNKEWKTVWKETFTSELKALTRKMTRKTEENHTKPH